MGDTLKKAEEIKTTDAKEVKKQKPSASYTLRSTMENIEKLKTLNLINEKEAGEMKQTMELAFKRWMHNM